MKIPFLSNVFEKRSNLKKPESWLENMFTGGGSYTGKRVSPNTASQSTAVYSCVRVLAETVASLPLHVYRASETGKDKADDHYLYKLLHDEPNTEMTSFLFREMMMYHIAIWGNFYAEKEYNGRGEVIALWPLIPDRVQVMRDPKTLKKIYKITDVGVHLSQDKVFHVPGFQFDGLKGKSPISAAKEAVGLALAAEEYGARYFGNGARPGGVLEHPGQLEKKGMDKLRESWNEMHQGLDKQHRIAILEEGMQYKQIGIPPSDSQFLETRKFQLNEIARIFRVPPHMIGDLERSTNNNIEHQSIEFVVHTIRPYLVRIEQAINKDLFTARSKGRYMAEFVVDGLLRGDIQSRYSAYSTARQWGWMSVNDIRKLENLNTIENGDVYLQPMNMVEAGSVPLNTEPDPPEIIEDRCIKAERKETRAQRSASSRYQMTQTHEKRLEQMARKVVAAEVKELKIKAEQLLTERSADNFLTWIEKFYREQMPSTIRKELMPPLRTFAVLIYAEVAKEVGTDLDFSRDIEQFLPKYGDGSIRRYTGSSKGQLRKILSNLNGDFDDIEERLDEWSEKKPGKVADNETTRLAGAVSKLAYVAAGKTILRWVNTSGGPCPYCEEMHDKTISINGNFVAGGTTFKPEGADGMNITTNISHPPLHQGCHCQIVAD